MLRLAALGLGLIQTRLFGAGQPKPGPASGSQWCIVDHAVIDVESRSGG